MKIKCETGSVVGRVLAVLAIRLGAFFFNAVFDKSVFSYLRTLTTWHCQHSPAAVATIDRYFLPACPTTANL